MDSAESKKGLSGFALLVRRRLPTRESLIVAAMTAVIFEFAYLAAFFVRGELLFKASDAATIVRTIWVVVALKMLIFYSRGLCHRPWRADHVPGAYLDRSGQ